MPSHVLAAEALPDAHHDEHAGEADAQARSCAGAWASPRGRRCRIATSVISGVAPLMIPASADEMCCSLKAKKQPAARSSSSSAATNSGPQYRRGGSGVRVTALTISIVTRPRNSRLSTTPAGVSDSRPSLMKYERAAPDEGEQEVGGKPGPDRVGRHALSLASSDRLTASPQR